MTHQTGQVSYHLTLGNIRLVNLLIQPPHNIHLCVLNTGFIEIQLILPGQLVIHFLAVHIHGKRVTGFLNGKIGQFNGKIQQTPMVQMQEGFRLQQLQAALNHGAQLWQRPEEFASVCRCLNRMYLNIVPGNLRLYRLFFSAFGAFENNLFCGLRYPTSDCHLILPCLFLHRNSGFLCRSQRGQIRFHRVGYLERRFFSVFLLLTVFATKQIILPEAQKIGNLHLLKTHTHQLICQLPGSVTKIR